MAKIEMRCAKCDSAEVYQDAWAQWDTEKQCWELGPTFDQAFCQQCEGETEIYECEIEESVTA